MTRIECSGDNLPADLLDAAPPLNSFVLPAIIFDKTDYSPSIDGRLATLFRQESVDTLVVTGGETDVSVLATVPGAIDLGFKVIILSDAVCSGADETHDAAVDPLAERFSVQLELATTKQFLGSVGEPAKGNELIIFFDPILAQAHRFSIWQSQEICCTVILAEVTIRKQREACEGFSDKPCIMSRFRHVAHIADGMARMSLPLHVEIMNDNDCAGGAS